AERQRVTRFWTGDVWKLHDCLVRHRPDLLLLPLDTKPSGLLLVAGLDPANRTLSEQYNPLVRQNVRKTLQANSDGRIERPGALSPSHPRVEALLALLRAARDSEVLRDGHPIFRRMLRSI
ncbi:MAG: hypothetical protein GTO22_19065, partial [Gemmatimonadales bacterium]|nr:hypothetical protein [Gemmatimonadales bacterium]